MRRHAPESVGAGEVRHPVRRLDGARNFSDISAREILSEPDSDGASESAPPYTKFRRQRREGCAVALAND